MRFQVWRRRYFVQSLLLAAGVFLAVVLAAAESERKNSTSPAASSDQVSVDAKCAHEGRLREGSEVDDLLGEFLRMRDRITFQTRDRNLSLQPLENLALERIARVLDETRERRLWTVSGTVTEYRGANYLLITRAVLKATSSTESKTVERKAAEKKQP